METFNLPILILTRTDGTKLIRIINEHEEGCIFACVEAESGVDDLTTIRMKIDKHSLRDDSNLMSTKKNNVEKDGKYHMSRFIIMLYTVTLLV